MEHNVPFSHHALRVDLIHVWFDAFRDHSDAWVGLNEVRLRADLSCSLVREESSPRPVPATAGDRALGPFGPWSRGATDVPYAVSLAGVFFDQRNRTSGGLRFGDRDVVPSPDADSLSTRRAAG